MSPKPRLPGVDEKALAALARQFPSSAVDVGAVPAAETKAPAASEPAKTPSASPEPAKPPAAAGDVAKGPTTSIPEKVSGAIGEAAKTPAAVGAPEKTPGAAAEPAKPSGAASSPAKVSGTTEVPSTPEAPRSPTKPPDAAARPVTAPGAAPLPPPLTPAGAVQPRNGGRAMATVALLAALLALMVAGAAIAPQTSIEWLKAKVGSAEIIDFLTERRNTIEAKLAAGSASIDTLEAQTKASVARLEAIEAVGGSSQAAAKRIDALEAAVNGLSARLAASDETARAVLARLGAMTARLGEIEGAVKATGTQISAIDDAQKRTLGELSAGLEALKKIDRRPERLYLVAMQIHSATQTSRRFSKELAAVTSLAGNGEEMRNALKILASRAESGVPTVADLRATFATNMSPRLATYAPPSRESAAERGTAWVRSFFALGQPRPDPSGSRNAVAIAAAERNLSDGQLAAAVDQLLLLEGHAALVVTEWLREASARLAIDKAATTIMAQAFEQLVSAP